MDSRDIGINPFQKMRESLNTSIKELSKALGVSYMTIIQAEQGLIKRPLRYARALEREGLIESAEQILNEQWNWLFKLRKSQLRQIRAGTRS